MAQQQNALQEIKKGLTGAGAITMFRDVLPNVSGKLAYGFLLGVFTYNVELCCRHCSSILLPIFILFRQ